MESCLAAVLSAIVLGCGATSAQAEGEPTPHINDTVSVASFCLGENAFVTGGIFGRLFRWSLETGKVDSTYTFPNDDDRSMFTATCSSDGTRIAVGLDHFMVAVWDGTSGKIDDIMTGHDPEADSSNPTHSSVDAVSLSDDAKLIASAHGKKVDIWTADGGKLLRQIKSNISVYAAAFINDGREIAITDQYSKDIGNTTMGVWNVQTGKRVREFAPVHDPSLTSTISSDGKAIASGGLFGTITVWNVASGKIKSQFRFMDEFETLALAPDKRSVLIGTESGEIAWLNAETGEEIGRLVGHTDRVRTVSFSPDGRRILSGSEDGTFRLWDAKEHNTILIGEAGKDGWASWTPEFAFVTSPNEAFKVFSHFDLQTLQITPDPDFTDDKARPDLVAKALAR
jgi:WD40 repeat protein